MPQIVKTDRRQIIFFKEQFEVVGNVVWTERTPVRPYTYRIIHGEGLAKICQLFFLPLHQILEIWFCAGNDPQFPSAAFAFGFILFVKGNKPGDRSVDKDRFPFEVDIAPPESQYFTASEPIE